MPERRKFTMAEYRQHIDSALSNDSTEYEVQMMFGEAFLFHLLLQEHAIPYVDDERFIPLMERSKARIDAIGEQMKRNRGE